MYTDCLYTVLVLPPPTTYILPGCCQVKRGSLSAKEAARMARKKELRVAQLDCQEFSAADGEDQIPYEQSGKRFFEQFRRSRPCHAFTV